MPRSRSRVTSSTTVAVPVRGRLRARSRCEIPDEADLVVVGNPTNPTGVLHPAEVLERLRRPGRVMVVDEAFMDAVPGGTETMLSRPLDGVVVLRSLTKHWSIPGIRAGYVVGDAGVVRRLAAQQTPWSVPPRQSPP
jgi:cobyrinic acid a,c-diamide synthase